MASGPSSFILDADLHGLADGHIEPDRRIDALRRLAGSPADRARVEAWQSQNELIRSTFASVDREPLPAMLDLTTKARLHGIPANDSPLIDIESAPSHPKGSTRFGIAVAAILLAASGLAGTWMMLGSAEPNDPPAGAGTHGSVEATLASLSTDAIGAGPPSPGTTLQQIGDRLPTTQIPDLHATGFNFTGAEIAASEPVSISFRYQNSRADRLVIVVARAAQQDGSPAAPARIGNAYTWHNHENAFALAGTLRPGDLRAIAVALQKGDPPD